MKVLFCDPLNTQNWLYVCAKHLRQTGIDAHTILGLDSIVPEDSLPSWHDEDVSASDWVHPLRLPHFAPYKNPIAYLTRLKTLIDFANGFDVIVCSGYAPMWIRWTRKPFIFYSYGSDLDQLAVQGWSGTDDGPFSLGQRMLHFLIKHHLTGSLRKAKATVLMPHQIETAKLVGLKNLHCFPHNIDTQLFKPMGHQQRRQEKQKVYSKFECDFILFHPPRQSWLNRPFTDCKGNDKVFRAFAEFVRVYKGRAKLLVMRKGWDVDSSINLIHELGISEHVVWLDPVPGPEMCRLYNIADIVLDQFVVGVIALVPVEAMSCGTPVVSYVAPIVKDAQYPEIPPIINAHDDDEILKNIHRLAEDEDLRNDIGRRGREWIEAYCDPEVTGTRWIELFQQVTGNGK